MKNVITFLLLFSFNISCISQANVQGHDQGGGGGGFCVAGKCKTLTEAGFRLKKTQEAESPILTKNIIIALKAILEKTILNYQMRYILEDLSLPDTSHFIKVEIANGELYEKSKKEYLDILNQQGFPTENFELFAFTNSTEKKTYILPSFFLLDDAGKAKILIHEGIVRQTGSVILALNMDISIERTLNGDSDLFGTALAFCSLGVLSDTPHDAVMAAFARDYYNKNRQPLRMTETFLRRPWYDINQTPDAAELFAVGQIFWQALHKADVRFVKWIYKNDEKYYLPHLSDEAQNQVNAICAAQISPQTEEMYLFEDDSVPYLLVCLHKEVEERHKLAFFKDSTKLFK